MKTKALLLTFIILSFIGCSKSIDKRFDKTKDGKPVLSSLIIFSTFEDMPLGKTSQNVLINYRRHLFEYSFPNPDSIMPNPKIVNSLLGKKVTDVRIASSNKPYIHFDFLSDTCVSVFIFDTTKNENHLKACIDIITKVFGTPTYDNINPSSKSVVKGTDHYTWKKSLLFVELVRWKWDNGYFIDFHNEKLTKYEKLVDSVTPLQPL